MTETQSSSYHLQVEDLTLGVVKQATLSTSSTQPPRDLNWVSIFDIRYSFVLWPLILLIVILVVFQM